MTKVNPIFGTSEQVAATRIQPPEQPWPEQDIPYIAWDNYTRGFEAGVAYQKAKEADPDNTGWNPYA